MRHLIVKIDGPTNSKDGFTGEVCKLLKHVEKMDYNPDFTPVQEFEDLIELPAAVVEDMSTDARLAYKLVKAVKAGSLPDDLREVKIGPLNHACWLTMQIRILYLHTRKHDLKVKNLRILGILVEYAMQSYFKIFFEIKVKHKLENAPYHILTQLRILRTQPKRVQDIVSPYIKSCAYFAHSENLLCALISSQDQYEREFGVQQILKLRKNQKFGDMSNRSHLNHTG